jgi:hypothetical protein
MKTHWTWEEWLASREERRAVSNKVCPRSIRRSRSSSDRRLKRAFGGERHPGKVARPEDEEQR